MDYIHIENLSVFGKHGVYEEERQAAQEFEISVRIGFETSTAGKSDNLIDTLNYQWVKETAEETITGVSCYLIETLAEKIATKVLTDSRVLLVQVTIKKVSIWNNGIPGVTILRQREVTIEK
jgi:dihydroneopterin aldolase